jgi:hypothetical protein
MSCTCKYGGGPAGICGFCRHRRATNERLAKLEEAKASSDYARGVADERARVVADLRKQASHAAILRSMEATRKARTLREMADRYERGEHEEAT